MRVAVSPRVNTATRRLVVLVAVGLLPWSVLVGPAGVDLVFLWGLANPATGHFVGLPAYLFTYTSGLPDRLLAWPASALCYLAGVLAEVTRGRVHDDPRLAAGLVGFAALAHLPFALGLARPGAPTVLPLGPVLAGGLAWWLYEGSAGTAERRER